MSIILERERQTARELEWRMKLNGTRNEVEDRLEV